MTHHQPSPDTNPDANPGTRPDTSAPQRGPHQPRAPWWAPHTTAPLLTPGQARYRTKTGILAATATLLAITLGLYWILTATEVRFVSHEANGALAYRQTTNALLAGCGPEYTFPNATAQSGTVPEHTRTGALNTQDYLRADHTIIPIYGHFWNAPAPTGQTFWKMNETNPPRPENLLANQWRGQMVAYYTVAVPAVDVRALRRLTITRPDLGLLVAPWNPTRGPMPLNRNIAFATWDHSQTCMRLSIPALEDFRRHHPATQAPGYHGAPPPAARRP